MATLAGTSPIKAPLSRSPINQLAGTNPARRKQNTKFKDKEKEEPEDDGFKPKDKKEKFGIWDEPNEGRSAKYAEYRIFLANLKYFSLEANLYIKDIHYTYSTRLPTHPLETGMIKHDHKIVEPRRYTATAYIRAFDENLEATAKECSKLLDELVASTDLGDYLIVYSPMDFNTGAKKDEKHPLDFRLYLSSYKRNTLSDGVDAFSYTLELQELFLSTSETKKSNNADFAGKSSQGGKGGGTKG